MEIGGTITYEGIRSYSSNIFALSEQWCKVSGVLGIDYLLINPEMGSH